MLPPWLDPRPYCADRPEPRRETRTKRHNLDELGMSVRCAGLRGVEDWVGMAAFAAAKDAWVRGLLELPNGSPSHDPLRDGLGRIAPVAFTTAFTAWARAALPGLADEQGCVDGQTVRGSRDGVNGAGPLVSAFAGRARWVLGQPAVAEKSHEITAIPALLGLLDLHGARGSIEAMGWQKAIAQPLLEAGADYGLARKDNPPPVGDAVQRWLDTEGAGGRLTVTAPVEKAPGRSELRRYALSRQIDWLDAKPEGTGLQAVGRVDSPRLIGDQPSPECRSCLCSFLEQDRFAVTGRRHGGLDNQPHWGLAVPFGEDACRPHHDPAAEHLALVRRLALNMLRHNGPPRDSIRRRKRRAALNEDYRLRLRFGQPSPTTP